jgi:formate hydrogenlyase subunit 6/NADH:ubiquinone oxidoreductase subunit I
MFKKVNTEQYPEQKKGANLPIEPRFHGRHVLNRHPTAWRSASAASCAPGPAPPTRSTSRAPTTPRTQRYSPGERYGRVYQINYLRCISAGSASRPPHPRVTMSNEYELADTAAPH